jgi:hypothetical protein
MQSTPADRTTTIDPDAGPASITPQATGETCTSNLTGCNFTESCTVVDDAGDSESFSLSYMVAGDGAITGTESSSVSITVLGQTTSVMCAYTVIGTKVN